MAYPAEVSASVNQTVNYSAVVDVNEVPADPEVVIDSKNPKTEKVTVWCYVGARLTAVGENSGVEVKVSGSNDNDWRHREFTRSGRIEWSWDVTPKIPADRQVRLQLRPAVKISDQDPASNSDPPTADYVSEVRVKATAIEKLSYWIDTQGKTIGAIFTALTLAVVAVLASIKRLRDAVREAFTKKKAEPGSESKAEPESASDPLAQQPKPREPKGKAKKKPKHT